MKQGKNLTWDQESVRDFSTYPFHWWLSHILMDWKGTKNYLRIANQDRTDSYSGKFIVVSLNHRSSGSCLSSDSGVCSSCVPRLDTLLL